MRGKIILSWRVYYTCVEEKLLYYRPDMGAIVEFVGVPFNLIYIIIWILLYERHTTATDSYRLVGTTARTTIEIIYYLFIIIIIIYRLRAHNTGESTAVIDDCRRNYCYIVIIIIIISRTCMITIARRPHRVPRVCFWRWKRRREKYIRLQLSPPPLSVPNSDVSGHQKYSIKGLCNKNQLLLSLKSLLKFLVC